MRRQRVLFVAELGGGFGHVRRLLPLARAAKQLGYQPTFLVQNPREVGRILDDEFELARAPVAPPPPRASEPSIAHSFADLLARAGFADTDFIARSVHAWRRVIGELAPVAAFCEFSPFFCWATRGSTLRVLVTGYGFVLPPPTAKRFPPLLAREVRDSEPRLLELLNATAQRLGQPMLAALPELLHGTANAVTGLELLDPYAAHRSESPFGPPGLSDYRALDAAAASEDLFGYLLGDAADTTNLLRALAESGVSGRVHVRRGTVEQQRILAPSRIAWLSSPEPTATALPRARLIVHHASMSTSEESIVCGRSQLVLPLYFEHLFTARALSNAGCATIVRPGTPLPTLTEIVRAALADSRRQHAAQQLAQALRPRLPTSTRLFELLRAVLP